MQPSPRARIVAALLLAAAVAALPARAKEGGDPARAKDLFVEAQELYNAGEYAKALIDFNASYDAYPLYEVLYNVALCYEKLGQKEKAIEYYQRYLESEKDPAEREKVEGRIARLEKDEEGEKDEEEGDDDEEGGTAAKIKEKLRRLAKGPTASWMHGLRLTLTGEFTDERHLNVYSPAWGMRLGYELRLKGSRLSLSLELGYGQVYADGKFLYVDNRRADIFTTCMAGTWEVFSHRARLLQIFVGGAAELKYYFREARGIAYRVYFGVGPHAELAWNFIPRMGLTVGLSALAGVISKHPHWGVDFIVKIGFVWGLK